jgi:hypothetical protein
MVPKLHKEPCPICGGEVWGEKRKIFCKRDCKVISEKMERVKARIAREAYRRGVNERDANFHAHEKVCSVP